MMRGGRFLGSGNFMLVGLLILLLLAILVCVIYLVIKTAQNSKRDAVLGNSSTDLQDNKKEALKILDQRFVNGEISEEEYKTKKELITK